MNRNVIRTEGYSNSDTKTLYEKCSIDCQLQCGGCSYYAIFNADWGLCCNPESRFHLETVFEHFGCKKNVPEGRGAHSFQDKPQHNIDDLTHLLRRCMEVFEGEIIRKRHKSLLLEIRHYFRSHGMAYYLKDVPVIKRTRKCVVYSSETDKENWDQNAEEKRLTSELLRLDNEKFQSILNNVLTERHLVNHMERR